MPEPINYTINAEAWRRALLAIKRQMLDAEPVEATRLIDEIVERLSHDRDRADASEMKHGGATRCSPNEVMCKGERHGRPAVGNPRAAETSQVHLLRGKPRPRRT